MAASRTLPINPIDFTDPPQLLLLPRRSNWRHQSGTGMTRIKRFVFLGIPRSRNPSPIRLSSSAPAANICSGEVFNCLPPSCAAMVQCSGQRAWLGLYGAARVLDPRRRFAR